MFESSNLQRVKLRQYYAHSSSMESETTEASVHQMQRDSNAVIITFRWRSFDSVDSVATSCCNGYKAVSFISVKKLTVCRGLNETITLSLSPIGTCMYGITLGNRIRSNIDSNDNRKNKIIVKY
ncbi:unnamed protein product [Allacma fusca]|uniref:Uncharacterized protein n=1 Tax=Allacma fusca TaxID=39272 RepID=A0A8J2PXI6_9HEXA|nr:unnamed protein product [Allacma fusca]